MYGGLTMYAGLGIKMTMKYIILTAQLIFFRRLTLLVLIASRNVNCQQNLQESAMTLVAALDRQNQFGFDGTEADARNKRYGLLPGLLD